MRYTTQIRLPEYMAEYIEKESEMTGISKNAVMCQLMSEAKSIRERYYPRQQESDFLSQSPQHLLG